jgi:hypothetical protein
MITAEVRLGAFGKWLLVGGGGGVGIAVGSAYHCPKWSRAVSMRRVGGGVHSVSVPVHALARRGIGVEQGLSGTADRASGAGFRRRPVRRPPRRPGWSGHPRGPVRGHRRPSTPTAANTPPRRRRSGASRLTKRRSVRRAAGRRDRRSAGGLVAANSRRLRRHRRAQSRPDAARGRARGPRAGRRFEYTRINIRSCPTPTADRSPITF